VTDNSPIRTAVRPSFVPDFLYALTLAFPSWAGVLAIAYAFSLSGLRPLQCLFRDLNH